MGASTGCLEAAPIAVEADTAADVGSTTGAASRSGSGGCLMGVSMEAAPFAVNTAADGDASEELAEIGRNDWADRLGRLEVGRDRTGNVATFA
jgi:hypothetical protein